MAIEDYLPTDAELRWLEDLAEFNEDEADEIDEMLAYRNPDFPTEAAARLAKHSVAEAALYAPPEEFARFIANGLSHLIKLADIDDEIPELVAAAFKVGIEDGSDICAHELGALYYRGELLEQDFAKAKELYEIGAARGCAQSRINLGYIYEYGRTGAPDYDEALRCYSVAAALAPSSEAVCKLGDCFARGRGVPQDRSQAHQLYLRSLELAKGPEERAQPALRLARMLIDPDGGSYGVSLDPLKSLEYFQIAEIGLRKSIAQGETYYERRLAEAIAGQDKARELVEAVSGLDAADWGAF